jgi:hypothetical protein
MSMGMGGMPMALMNLIAGSLKNLQALNSPPPLMNLDYKDPRNYNN